MITDYTFAPANMDERDVASEVTQDIHGLLGADKGYLRPTLKEYYESHGIDLQTPLRKNMVDPRAKESMRLLMKEEGLKRLLVSWWIDLIFKK